MEKKWKIYTVGICEPFSPGGVAAYQFSMSNDWGTNFYFHGYGIVAVGGPEATLHAAEYMGLLKGLAEVDRLIQRGERIEIQSESQSLIDELIDNAVNDVHLKPLHERASYAISGFRRSDRPVDLTWIPPGKRYYSDSRKAKQAIEDAGKADPEILKKIVLTFGEHEGKTLHEAPRSYYERLWTNTGGEILIPYRPVVD